MNWPLATISGVTYTVKVFEGMRRVFLQAGSTFLCYQLSEQLVSKCTRFQPHAVISCCIHDCNAHLHFSLFAPHVFMFHVYLTPLATGPLTAATRLPVQQSCVTPSAQRTHVVSKPFVSQVLMLSVFSYLIFIKNHRGTFRMEREDGKYFDIRVPPFTLNSCDYS